MLEKILFLIFAIFIVGLLYVTVRGNNELFSRSKLSQSFWTLGWLTLILIAFVAGLVFLVKHS